MIPYGDVWHEVHVRRSTRAVASEWMRVGALPLTLVVGCLSFSFDGARLFVGRVGCGGRLEGG